MQILANVLGIIILVSLIWWAVKAHSARIDSRNGDFAIDRKFETDRAGPLENKRQ